MSDLKFYDKIEVLHISGKSQEIKTLEMKLSLRNTGECIFGDDFYKKMPEHGSGILLTGNDMFIWHP